MVKFTRRGFMIGGAVTGGTIAGALALGVGFLSTVDTEGLEGNVRSDGTIDLNAWITIQTDGRIIFSIPRNEMGQGVYTALPMLIAEELEIDIHDPNFSVEHPTETLPVYTNFVLALRKRPEMIGGAADWLGQKIYGLVGFIGTGGSTSVVDAYTPLRRAGAAAREMLVTAAANRWGVPVSDCYAENAHVIRRSTGEKLSYGDVAADAAKVTPNKKPKMKAASEFKVIGKPLARIDIPSKTRGEAKFGIDTVLEGMKYAAVVQSPVFGGTVRMIDDSEAKKVKGYRRTVDLGDGVAVVADNYYYAKKAAGLLNIEYDEGTNNALSSAKISEMLRAAVDTGETHTFIDEGDTLAATSGDDAFEARYELPYLAHACMEPMNATAVVRDGHCEIWASSQVPLMMESAAKAHVQDLKSVVAHTTLSGGGFGRRAEGDFIVHAVKVAVAMPGVPVQTIWSREEDIQHDTYRPAVAAKVRASLNADGTPEALDYKIALQSVGLSFSRRNLPIEMGGLKDAGNIEGVREIPYHIEKKRISNSTIDIKVPVGNWRSVGYSYNAFFLESFMDELAIKAGADPLHYRKDLLKGHARMHKLAERLEQVSGWGTQVGEGKGRGVAIHASFRSYVGQVIDISLVDGAVKIDKITCVIDCGQVVNPDTVAAQMESGIIYGLTAAMYGEITIEDGRAVQSNFPDYEMLRLRQTPEIVVDIINSTELPGGVGEPGTPPVFPALANAYFNLTGKRLRSMPLTKHGVEFN
ncbi:MAG: hypothetical protein COB37_08875 [Kordiimonadales bacterium]|nr:MAG: hypothetical protein COB37_08875 [Kordiimonadales bacterium]